jgi:hypothetical protein
MKNADIVFFVALGGLTLFASQSIADPLDDIIADMRKGAASVDKGKQVEVLKAANAAAYQTYKDAIVGLYLCEVKMSLIDPDNNGGWPNRTFMLEDNLAVRKHLTKELSDRFGKEPSPILAYALICPALYAKDEKLLAQAESYLRDHDSFLYKQEHAQIEKDWRPYIKDILAKETKPSAK